MRGFYSNSDKMSNKRTNKINTIIYNFSKKRFMIIGVTLALLATVAALSLSTVIVHADTEQNYIYKSIEIMPNDSLWSIATEYCPNDIEINDYIDTVEELNGISSDYIIEGNYILIPVYE